MKYYSEADLRKIVPLHYWLQILARSKPINVRFCRDCPSYNPLENKDIFADRTGWCAELSWFDDEDATYPRFIYVNENNFCNEDDRCV